MTPKLVNRVFVYGTLMPGELRWPLLAPFVVTWEPTAARGQLWDTGRGYPAARFDDGQVGAQIPGFLVHLNEEVLPDAIVALDGIEGEGVLYRRVTVATTGGDAFSYEWLGSVDGLAPLVEGWPRTSRVNP